MSYAYSPNIRRAQQSAANRKQVPRVKQLSNAGQAVRSMLAEVSSKLASSPADALQLAESALLTARPLGDHALTGEALLSLAECSWRLGELDRANELIGESLEAFERAGKTRQIGRAYRLQTMLYSSQDRVSLALAAGAKAVTCHDLTGKDRALLFALIASCLSRIFDLPTGLAVMEERALPEADRSGDPETIFGCYVRAAMMLDVFACLSANIPNHFTVGMQPPPDLRPPLEYLDRASNYLRVCEAQGVLPVSTGAIFFGVKAGNTTLRGDFERAQTIYAQARTHATMGEQFPRNVVTLLISEGDDARVAGRWEHALRLLGEAQRYPQAQIPANERCIQFNLSIIYRALGRTDEALQALQRFTDLQSNMTRLATSWIDDALHRRRYGDKLDLTKLKVAVLNPAEPAALRRAVQYVEGNFDRRLTLSDVARRSGVSGRRLHTLFKTFKGVSPSVFIKGQKLQHAYQMLSRGESSVTRVTDAIGYSSPANFARDFRQRFDCTPSEIQRGAQRDVAKS